VPSSTSRTTSTETATRLGFIVADDLEAVEEFVVHDIEPITNATVDERLDALNRFAVSPPYLRLRRELGLAVDSSGEQQRE